jgi:hypothetical protein
LPPGTSHRSSGIGRDCLGVSGHGEGAEQDDRLEDPHELELTLDEVDQIRRSAQTPVSLEKPVGDDEESEFGHFITDELAPQPEDVAEAVDEDQPYGRVCLSLFEPGPPEKEEAFQMSLPPGPGKTVRAYVDASEKCTVLLAAITKDGKLANGWRPQLSEVPDEFEEILLPKAPVKWDWSAASGPFDFFVLFLAPGSKEVEEAKKLVEAMRNPKVDDRVLALQSADLGVEARRIGPCTVDKDDRRGLSSHRRHRSFLKGCPISRL